MNAAEYSFVTHWRLRAPVDEVWDAISHSERWPSWWRGLERVEELKPAVEASGVGSLRRYTWKSRLPYRLTFDLRVTRVEPLVLMESEAHGELEGRGLWRFSREGGVTVARYDWNVRTRIGWMNGLAPVAKPLFRWNHNVVMRWGGEGLARRLGDRP